MPEEQKELTYWWPPSGGLFHASRGRLYKRTFCGRTPTGYWKTVTQEEFDGAFKLGQCHRCRLGVERHEPRDLMAALKASFNDGRSAQERKTHRG